jgi:hypothetical protein
MALSEAGLAARSRGSALRRGQTEEREGRGGPHRWAKGAGVEELRSGSSEALGGRDGGELGWTASSRRGCRRGKRRRLRCSADRHFGERRRKAELLARCPSGGRYHGRKKDKDRMVVIEGTETGKKNPCIPSANPLICNPIQMEDTCLCQHLKALEFFPRLQSVDDIGLGSTHNDANDRAVGVFPESPVFQSDK